MYLITLLTFKFETAVVSFSYHVLCVLIHFRAAILVMSTYWRDSLQGGESEKTLIVEDFKRMQRYSFWPQALVVLFIQEGRNRNGVHDTRTEGDREKSERLEIGREGSVQLCASLGFLLSTSSCLGQTGIIRFGKLPERPLWRSHGTLVCLFNCG